jgi:hypothetical protein
MCFYLNFMIFRSFLELSLYVKDETNTPNINELNLEGEV